MALVQELALVHLGGRLPSLFTCHSRPRRGSNPGSHITRGFPSVFISISIQRRSHSCSPRIRQHEDDFISCPLIQQTLLPPCSPQFRQPQRCSPSLFTFASTPGGEVSLLLPSSPRFRLHEQNIHPRSPRFRTAKVFSISVHLPPPPLVSNDDSARICGRHHHHLSRATRFCTLHHH